VVKVKWNARERRSSTSNIYGSKRSPPHIVICYTAIGKAHDHCQGPKPKCSVRPPLSLHFDHWEKVKKKRNKLNEYNLATKHRMVVA